jgi:MFS family permease
VILALASALATNLAFLFKHRGAVLAPPMRVRHPLRSAAGLFRSRWFAVGCFYIVLFAVSNFFGPLLLGRLFDTVGRKPMIAGTYIGSAVVLTVLTILFVDGRLGVWGFMALLLVTFFLASAGASSAYLTVSEIFPMETRALAIAFFYATGAALGGITGPFLFGKMIESGEASQVAIAFFIGAAVMAVGGIVELFFGVKAEQMALEDVAKPLTAQDAETDDGRDRDEAAAPSAQRGERDLAGTAVVRERERERRRRYRLGPGQTFYSPGMIFAGPITEVESEREVAAIEGALADGGPTDRRELAPRARPRMAMCSRFISDASWRCWRAGAGSL